MLWSSCMWCGPLACAHVELSAVLCGSSTGAVGGAAPASSRSGWQWSDHPVKPALNNTSNKPGQLSTAHQDPRSPSMQMSGTLDVWRCTSQRAPEQELWGCEPAVCTHSDELAPLQPSQVSPSHCSAVSCPRAAHPRPLHSGREAGIAVQMGAMSALTGVVSISGRSAAWRAAHDRTANMSWACALDGTGLFFHSRMQQVA